MPSKNEFLSSNTHVGEDHFIKGFSSIYAKWILTDDSIDRDALPDQL